MTHRRTWWPGYALLLGLLCGGAIAAEPPPAWRAQYLRIDAPRGELEFTKVEDAVHAPA